MLLGACTPDSNKQILDIASTPVGEAGKAIQAKIQLHQDRVKVSPSDPTAIGELGIVYELHGFPDQALACYQIAAELDPAEGRWPYYQAILLAARFDMERALESVKRAVEIDPAYSPMWIMQGQILLDFGEHQAALNSFLRAAELGDDPYIYVGQAHAYLALGELEKALTALKGTGELASHPNIARLEATILVRTGQKERAEHILKSLPDRARRPRWSDPMAEFKSSFAVSNLSDRLAEATGLIRDKSLQSAYELLTQLKDEFPTNKHVLQMMSDVFELQGQVDQALAELSIAIAHHPNYYPLRTSAARILRTKGELDEALRHLNAAIEFEPQLDWAYTHKAQILMSQKKWMEASAVLDKAIDISPDDPDLYTHLGICLGFLNRWPEARVMFEVAITKNDLHVPSYINLARAQAILGWHDAASQSIQDAQDKGASDAQIESLKAQITQIEQMNIQIERR